MMNIGFELADCTITISLRFDFWRIVNVAVNLVLNGVVLSRTNNVLKNPIVGGPTGTSMTIQAMNLTKMSLLGNDPTG